MTLNLRGTANETEQNYKIYSAIIFKAQIFLTQRKVNPITTFTRVFCNKTSNFCSQIAPTIYDFPARARPVRAKAADKSPGRASGPVEPLPNDQSETGY